jgi:hypothetical protein
MNKKELFLNFLGITLIFIGIFRLWQIIYVAEDFPRYFWLCNSAPLIFGFAIFFRNNFVLIGEFSILFLGQIWWTIDFLFFLISGRILLGTSEYVFYEPFVSQIASVTVHILILPIALVAILLIGKENKNAWKFSFILFAVLLPFVLYFGSEVNLNFFFYSSISSLLKIPFYSILFPLGYIFLAVLPTNRGIDFLIRFSKKSNKLVRK